MTESETPLDVLVINVCTVVAIMLTLLCEIIGYREIIRLSLTVLKMVVYLVLFIAIGINYFIAVRSR